MTDQPTAPITITADPTISQLAVALRQLLLALGPVCALMGFTHLGTLLGLMGAVCGPLATVVVIIMGQLHERHGVAKQVLLAQATPDEVVVK